MLSSTLNQATRISYAASPTVPMLVNPRAANTRSMPLYGTARSELRQGGGAGLLAMVMGSAIAGAMSGTAFYVYKRTNSAAWAGTAAGIGSLAVGLLALGVSSMER